jgi:hypothetical protein
MLALGVMLVPPERADRVSRAVGVRGRPGQDTGMLAAWPGLERKVRERRKALGSSWDDVRRLAMHVDARAPAAVSVPIEARRCLDVLVAPSDEVQAIDATVTDEEGRVLARGRPPGRDRAFVLCSASDATLTILVRPRLASGLVAVVVGRSPPGAASELDDAAWIDAVSPLVPMKEALERHRVRTQNLAMPAAREIGHTDLAVGVPRALEVSLSRGCTRIDAVGGTPLGSFTAALWTDDGRRLSQARGGELATLFYCGAATKARVELNASERGGPVTLVARHDDKAPAALVDRGVAASALLERLDAALGPIAPRDAASVEVLELSGYQRRDKAIDIPAQSCTDVVVAIDGQARGVILEVDDGSRVARGERVTAERLCAAAQARRVTLKVASATGPGSALFLTRRASD